MLGTAARVAVALSLAGVFGCNSRKTLSPRPDASSDAASEASADDAEHDASQESDGAPDCVTGTVSFSFHAAASSATSYCVGQPGVCTSAWLSILTADGQVLSLVYGCVPDCSSCHPESCPTICETPSPLGSAGVQRSWGGTFVEHLTCGASIACTRVACAPAGKYIARMCGFADASGDASTCQSGATTCVDVPFTWPPPSGAPSVMGVIGGGDAGTAD